MAELDALRTEFLGKSATTIQTKYRSHYARKTYLTLRFSTIQIQAYCRGTLNKAICILFDNTNDVIMYLLFTGMIAAQLAHQMYMSRKREVACVTIQKEIRANLSRRSYKKTQLSAMHIQAGLRGMSARQDFYVKREHYAATLIQVTTCIK